jgi:hypothetical protein
VDQTKIGKTMKWLLNIISKNPKMVKAIVIFLLRKAAKSTENSLDDDLVDLIENNL